MDLKPVESTIEKIQNLKLRDFALLLLGLVAMFAFIVGLLNQLLVNNPDLNGLLTIVVLAVGVLGILIIASLLVVYFVNRSNNGNVSSDAPHDERYNYQFEIEVGKQKLANDENYFQIDCEYNHNLWEHTDRNNVWFSKELQGDVRVKLLCEGNELAATNVSLSSNRKKIVFRIEIPYMIFQFSYEDIKLKTEQLRKSHLDLRGVMISALAVERDAIYVFVDQNEPGQDRWSLTFKTEIEGQPYIHTQSFDKGDVLNQLTPIDIKKNMMVG